LQLLAEMVLTLGRCRSRGRLNGLRARLGKRMRTTVGRYRRCLWYRLMMLGIRCWRWRSVRRHTRCVAFAALLGRVLARRVLMVLNRARHILWLWLRRKGVTSGSSWWCA
jgi:hypothetical protein